MRKPLQFPFNLWHDNNGIGALELALALPVLMLLLAGMIDMSRVISSRIDMEQAAIRATEFALAVRPTSSSSDYIKTEAATAANVPANNVTVQIFLECNGVRQTDFNTICPSTQDQARFVSVSIRRTVNAVFDWTSLAKLAGGNVGNADVTVTGNSVVRFQ